ncbi:MAG: ABC transporter substrate-binding protein [Prevotella sp.]|nr:ABC transporter substrate-binding protein [Prevotella sp.]
MKKIFFWCSVLLMLLAACRQGRVAITAFQGDTIRLKYAENIVIVRDSAVTKVELRNPWGEGVLHTYWLVSRDADFSPSEGTVVRVPLQRSVVFSTAHASLLLMLEADNAIAGVADLKYMLLPEIHRRVRLETNGKIVDCGDAMAPDIEKIVEIDADAILLSPFENSGGYGQLEKLGVPIVECAEYMETSALGRAEWMRFYGLLFGCEHQADSLFAEVEKEYFALSRSEDRGARSEKRLSILTERLTGGTWYVAGGRSSVGRLIADAGGDYAWADDEHSGSLPLSFEAVLDKAGDADIWIFNYTGAMPLTRKMLATEHHGYEAFKAFREGEIYYVNSLQVPYFEEVSFRPDWLLRDYVILLHPSKRNDEKLRYFQKINP